MTERRPHRVYTVEELRALPPTTEEQRERGRQALARIRARVAEDERALGRPITLEEVLDALGDWDDDVEPWRNEAPK